MSHDWPAGIHAYGDTDGLLRRKKHFREDIEAGSLGNPASADLLGRMQPRYWFSGHLHVKFAATVVHGGGAGGGGGGAGEGGAHPAASASTTPSTRFLALDKCLVGRDYLQVLDIPVRPAAAAAASPSLSYDAEWLAIVAKTHPLLPSSKRAPRLPPIEPITTADVEAMRASIFARNGGVLDIHPSGFVRTVAPFNPAQPGLGRSGPGGRPPLPQHIGNPQTDALLTMLGLPHMGVTVPWGSAGGRDETFGGSSGGGGADTATFGASCGRWGAQFQQPASVSVVPSVGAAPASAAAVAAVAVGAGLLPSSIAGSTASSAPRASLSLPAPRHAVRDDGAALPPRGQPLLAPAVIAPTAVTAAAAAAADPAEIDLVDSDEGDGAMGAAVASSTNAPMLVAAPADSVGAVASDAAAIELDV